MKIKNITGGILQDSKTGWTFQPDQIIEVDGTNPNIVERVKQLIAHKLVEVVDGNIDQETIVVNPVVVETSKEEGTESTTPDQVTASESDEEKPVSSDGGGTSTGVVPTVKKAKRKQ